MNFSDLSVDVASVEIWLFIAACVVLCVDLFIPHNYRRYMHWGVIAVLLLLAAMTATDYDTSPTTALNGFFVISPLAVLLKTTILLTVAGCLAFSRHYLESNNILRGELHSLGLFATLGMLVIVSAGHFLSLYMGLELMSLSLYAMIAMRKDNMFASESAIKYFVLGALASGLFLYGVSIIYGATGGKLYLDEIAQVIAAGDAVSREALTLGLVFVLAALAFKLGVAPFHMWLPDVYEGAPTAMTLFIATAPKVASMALMLRVLAETLAPLHEQWQDMLILLAVLSLAIGNITAIAQTRLKRMFAYSSIAHGGFMILGVLSANVGGVAAAVFYVMAYALMTVGGFGLLVLMADVDGRENPELADVKGLGTRNPLAAGVLMLLMFSMAGIPPVIGFSAKLTVLQATVEADLVWLAVVAVLFSVIGAFYYLRVVKLMFFDAADNENDKFHLTPASSALVAMIGLLVLGLGIFPDTLLSLCESALQFGL